MKRKIGFLALAVFLGLVVLPLGTFNSIQAEEVVNFKLAFPYPQTDQMWVGVDYMIKEIEKRTNGKVKIKAYPASSLGKVFDSIELLKSQTADIAFFPPIFDKFLRISGIYAVPTLQFQDRKVCQEVALALFEKGLLTKEYESAGIKPLFWLGTDPVGFVFKKKITTLEELQKLKMRTPPGMTGKALEALNLSVVSLPVGEVYMALSRGVVDGMTAMAGSFVSMKLYEISKYWLDLPIGAGACITAMSKKSWDTLPPDVQKIWEEVNMETMSYFDQEMNKRYGDWREWVKSLGVEVYELSPQEAKRWYKLMEGVEEEWVSTAEADGFPGKQALKIAKKIIAKHEKK